MINNSLCCESCQSVYNVEFYKEEVMLTDGKAKPIHCPFCGEEIDDQSFDDYDDEDDDLDRDDE